MAPADDPRPSLGPGPVVRPYALVRGRTKPAGEMLDVISMVYSLPRSVPDLADLEPEHLAVIRLRAVAESGIGVLLIEQFATVTLGLANHAYVMEGGRLRFSGLARELREKPELLRRRTCSAAAMALPRRGRPARPRNDDHRGTERAHDQRTPSSGSAGHGGPCHPG